MSVVQSQSAHLKHTITARVGGYPMYGIRGVVTISVGFSHLNGTAAQVCSVVSPYRTARSKQKQSPAEAAAPRPLPQAVSWLVA